MTVSHRTKSKIEAVIFSLTDLRQLVMAKAWLWGYIDYEGKKTRIEGIFKRSLKRYATELVKVKKLELVAKMQEVER